MNKEVLIICYSDLRREPRVLMECSALCEKYEITAAGLSGINQPGVKYIKLTGQPQRSLFQFHLKLPRLLRIPFSLANLLYFKLSGGDPSFSLSDYKSLKKARYSLIICHHPGTLALAFKLKERMGCEVVFNAHEIYALEFEDNQQWMKEVSPRIEEVLQRYLSQCKTIFTVNDEIAEFYRSRYSCNAVTVRNSKPFKRLPATTVQEPIQIIHHGGAMPQRKLEQMAEAVLALKGKYELTFMLVDTNSGYLKELKHKYEKQGVRFIPAVPIDRIVETINKYDIGLYMLPIGNINHKLALPNKLFEFLQARLAIVCTPNDAMKSLVMNNSIGVVTAGFSKEDMIHTLDSLKREDIWRYKQMAEKAALSLSSEVDESVIGSQIAKLVG